MPLTNIFGKTLVTTAQLQVLLYCCWDFKKDCSKLCSPFPMGPPCHLSRVRRAQRNPQYSGMEQMWRELPHLYNTLDVQHLVCTTSHLYNTSYVQNLDIQQLTCTKLICTTPHLYNTLDTQHLDIQHLDIQHLEYTTLWIYNCPMTPSQTLYSFDLFKRGGGVIIC